MKFWEENKIFEKSVEKNSADKSFIFYEGPPTANGVPGLHHVLARAFKDIIPRYKTMKGYRVERKAGWDTHGLPVELQVEKELGLRNKQDIENIVPGNPRESVIEFNKKCKESVWKYKDLWEKLTRRMGYWVDMKNPYITYENRYIESVWWVIAQIFKTKGKDGNSLIYKGHKVVPYCYRCGTTLSSHEVAQGYQTVKDNSIFVKFKIKPNPEKEIDDKTYFLVWTTTPWTLPGNVALAVGENIDYSKLRVKNLEDNSEEIFIVAEKRSGIIAEKYGFEAESDAWKNLLSGRAKFLTNVQKPRFQIDLLDSYTGKKLAGMKMKYEPLFLKELAESVITKSKSDQLIEPQFAIRDTGDNLFKERCREIIKDSSEIDKLKENSYKVYTARFISTEEGTGIVHIAPAFGEDDANLARDKELPTLHTVSREGILRKNLKLPGEGVAVKKEDEKGNYKVDQLIIEDLKKRGLLLKEELYEHEYPFCWRCETPLIYYAKPSWFIRMSELSEELVKNNEKINWVPENIKEGRFGEWLRGVKDWAISRERYWGTPLPIWECKKCGEMKVIESIDDIKEQLGDPNKLFIVRHGEAKNNVKQIHTSFPETEKYSLTDKGKLQVKVTAGELKDKQISYIFYSPVQRAKETAEIIAEEIGIDMQVDERLREWDFGNFNGKTHTELVAAYPNWFESRKKDINKVEGLQDVLVRMQSFLDDINKNCKGKNIVIISHGDPILALKTILTGENIKELAKNNYPEKGKYQLAYSSSFDLHKPFIDDIKLKCSCGEEMKRTLEVMDVWFDSGSMPLAQFYYPNQATAEDKEKIESGKYFPADYISEAIDQTRGWFYTLHAIATLLHKSKKVPEGFTFRNVICLGHILDAKGKKMSKSKGNVIDPMEVMDKYGADMLRWMLFTINQPGLPKRFDIKSMNEIMNRVFRMLWNSYSFFTMYAIIDKWKPKSEWKSVNILDKWIVSELNLLIKNVDEKLEGYDIYGAAGMIEKFIDNLSNWYIRRSRKRFWKSEDDNDKNEAYQTLHYVLVELSKLMAPFTPFMAEEIYKNLAGEESVHLADFPVADEELIDEKLNQEMENIRRLISEGLQQRAKAGKKVRQPLQSVTVSDKISDDLEIIVKDELNVKDVIIKPEVFKLNIEIQEPKIIIDTEITEELKLEGQAREIIRFIQEMRKEAGYEVDNRIKVCYNGMSEVFEKFGDIIKKEVLAEELEQGEMQDADLEKELSIDNENLKIKIKKSLL